MVQLILVRHGQSEWNQDNLFTGWVDVKLSPLGLKEAARAGRLLTANGIKPDVVYTSKLSRSIQTANIALNEANLLYLDTKRSWRLNERHYGALQGKDKEQVLAKYGMDQFMAWRRSFEGSPPPIEDTDTYSQVGDPRYVRDIPAHLLPRTESLKQVVDRLVPYWESDIAKDLRQGKTVIVFAHGNSLRALRKHLEGISDTDIARLNIPTGIPLVYELNDEDLKPVGPGVYLDPEAAAAGVAAIAAQGNTK